jgi:hypothetical protein
MKLRQFSLILTLAMLLTLAGASMLNAGEQCCVRDASGQCVPCPSGTTSASATTDTDAPQVNATFASSASMIPVRVITADGNQRVVAIPVNVLAGILANSAGNCGPQNCPPQNCDPQNCVPQDCSTTAGEAGAKRIAIPISECAKLKGMSLPTPEKTNSTSDVDTSI